MYCSSENKLIKAILITICFSTTIQILTVKRGNKLKTLRELYAFKKNLAPAQELTAIELEKIRQLIASKNKNEINKALIIESQYGRIKAVSQLLEAGADVNAIDNEGETALIKAAENGRAKIVKLLLTAGANVNIVNCNGETALIKADMIGCNFSSDIPPIGKGLLVTGKFVLGAKSVDIVKQLLQVGADVNKVSKDGRTALLTAILSCNDDVVKLLINAGANVNASDHFTGKTALIQAVITSRRAVKKIVPQLIKAGADINARDKEGNTALISTVRNGYFSRRQLVKGDHNTPVNNIAISQLIKAGADINIADKDGNTALIWAIKCKHNGDVKQLLKAGAAIDVKNNEGETALTLATAAGNNDIVNLLLKAKKNKKKVGYKDMIRNTLGI